MPMLVKQTKLTTVKQPDIFWGSKPLSPTNALINDFLPVVKPTLLYLDSSKILKEQELGNQMRIIYNSD